MNQYSILKSLLWQWFSKESIHLLSKQYWDDILSSINACGWDEKKMMVQQIEYLLDHWKDPWRYFTCWMQWEIYINELLTPEWSKKVLIIKKQRWTSFRNEVDCHIKAMNIFKEKSTWVPELYATKSYIKQDTNSQSYEISYMIMDYVEWKTLYCCLIEKYIERIIELHQELFVDSDFMVRYQNDFQDQSKMNSRSNINCRNDALAQSALIETLEILWSSKVNNELQQIKSKQASYPIYLIIMSLLNNESQWDVPLFIQEDFGIIKSFLKDIQDMNDQGLRHRDLWSNTRNIIIGDDNRFHLIDFWLSTIDVTYENLFMAHERKWWKEVVTKYLHDYHNTKQVLYNFTQIE